MAQQQDDEPAAERDHRSGLYGSKTYAASSAQQHGVSKPLSDATARPQSAPGPSHPHIPFLTHLVLSWRALGPVGSLAAAAPSPPAAVTSPPSPARRTARRLAANAEAGREHGAAAAGDRPRRTWQQWLAWPPLRHTPRPGGV